MQLLGEELSKTIVDAFYTVYRTLGYGFLERVYANALAVELQKRRVRVRREVPVEVLYEGVLVGNYRTDLIANDRTIIETKSTKALSEADERQLLNFLKASTVEIGYRLHFGPEPKFVRRILTNDRKHSCRVVRVVSVVRVEQFHAAPTRTWRTNVRRAHIERRCEPSLSR